MLNFLNRRKEKKKKKLQEETAAKAAKKEKVIVSLARDALPAYKESCKQFLLASIEHDGLVYPSFTRRVFHLCAGNYQIVSKLEALERRLDELANENARS